MNTLSHLARFLLQVAKASGRQLLEAAKDTLVAVVIGIALLVLIASVLWGLGLAAYAVLPISWLSGRPHNEFALGAVVAMLGLIAAMVCSIFAALIREGRYKIEDLWRATR